MKYNLKKNETCEKQGYFDNFVSGKIQLPGVGEYELKVLQLI